MGLQKYISEIKTINWSDQIVYSRLSNFETLNFIFNPENIERAKQELGSKADNFQLKNFKATRDECSFDVAPIGNISLEIAERESPKLIKIKSKQGSPIEFTLWIQLLANDQFTSKLRLTLHVELNMMMKMMLGSKLEKGINQFADGISRLPYHSIPDPNDISLN